MNIDELRTVQSRERSTTELQELRDSFYSDVADYINQLRAERDRLAADRDDPYDDEVIQLTDEVRTAEQVAESIYERRIGKVVKRASFAANGMGDSPTGLTAEERDLYTDIVDRIQSNKSSVLEVITQNQPSSVPETNASSDAPRSPDGDDRIDDPDSTSGNDAESESSDEEQPSTEVDVESADDPARKTIRITQDVGEIYGIDDRVYTLETDDVVRLPAENADPLLDRDAAEPLD